MQRSGDAPGPAPVDPRNLLGGFTPAFALRRALATGYTRKDLEQDVLAGMVVGIIALPLSMALAIASGVPPQHGLYTAMLAGALIAALGGSRVQVSGPTAAFVVILAPITARFGLGGLALAGLMAGLILIAMAVSRLGRFIEFVPHPVTAGFTGGIAVVIASLQVKDFFGLRLEGSPAEFFERLGALARGLPTLQGPTLAVGAFTLAVLLLWPRLRGPLARIPAPLVALFLGALLAAAVGWLWPGVEVETIASRFQYQVDGVTRGGIPRELPSWGLPWHLPGVAGVPLELSFDLVRTLLPSAFAIAMLGAIESLLSAVVADGMTRHRHDPNAELFGQGVGNLIAPFFGGIPATGAIARTAANVRAGARSPLAAITHSAVVLLALLALSPALGHLPMAALAALLLQVAWRMSEAKESLKLLRIAPRSDAVVLLTCFGLTVVFDMVVAVSVGMVLASFLFMKRMAEVTSLQLVDQPDRVLTEPLPKGTVLYQIAGPLFFGAAQKAMTAIQTVAAGVHTVVLDLRAAPALDATGLVSLEAAVDKLHHRGVFVVLAGLQDQPFRALLRAGWRHHDGVSLHRDFADGLATARRRPQEPP